MPRPSYVPIDLQPHRGALILILGILSLVPCGLGLLGPIAWVMGSTDLKEVEAGRMDPDGEGPTRAGRICAILGTVLLLLLQFPLCCGLGGWLVWWAANNEAP